MTLRAVIEIGDILVSALHIGRRVLVATVAGVRFEIVFTGVANGALIAATVTVIDRERVLERRAGKGSSSVALRAVRAELAHVHLRLRVTRRTRRRGSLEGVVHVTRLAIGCLVLAGEWERSLVVVERATAGQSAWQGRKVPLSSRVTLRAIRAELPKVNFRLGVTRRAGCRGSLECVIDMTRLAIRRLVLAGQFEGCLVVIERASSRQRTW